MPGDLGDAGFRDELARCERFTGFVHAASHRFRYQRFHLADAAATMTARAIDHDAPVALLRHVLPEMMAARFGRVVLVTSLAAAVGSAGAAHYAIDKAGLEALARALALEYGRFGITANAVQPGFIATSRLAERTREGALSAEELAAKTALKRLADPSEVAAAVAFLMGASASYVTGTTLAVTGGLHLNTLW
jgi:NAD(P)-dependent dehydrogenase (short-subunit alcohol dehydrogenase family)